MGLEDKAAKMIRTVVQVLEPQFAVRLWSGERIGPDDGPELVINDPQAIRRIVMRPKLDSIVEMWVSGQIDVQGGNLFDIAALGTRAKLKHRLKDLPKLQLLADMPSVLFGKPSKDSGLSGNNPFDAGSSKEAISHHYDISNEYYALFLDENMVYTCGYFTDWSNGIDQAQTDKLDHICKKLRLKPGETLLDIGCGWGSLLIHAAKNYGVTGHGVSLSEAQTALARERIRAEGLEDRITIEIKSYEVLEGTFDKIASIGMFEHVGSANYETYFSSVGRLLKPGGLYMHHAISRRAKRGKKAWRRKTAENRAIVKYIFPGGELDHLGMSIENLEGHGFEVHDVENLREHYGRTCRLWAERLESRFDEAVKEVGAPKARLWLLYLTGCSLAFERGTMQINQTLASKRVRGPSGLPPTRADLYR
ncbi:MAG: cyclopropane-fatty-acyl-phospholipid synthase family protein [Alphaproteobacteria bacterium]|nr:cyclopropane-fatty-acyl-phospholipid synthase family protein [Alphaproteobacteria bacterium]